MLRIITLSFLVSAGAASAQSATDSATDMSEFSRGQQEYMSGCAACHGENADGNGPIATMFKTPVPDLTGIAERNDGKFPLLDVMHIIDGRMEVRGHGNPMPIFGRRFETETEDTAGVYGSEPMVRGRVLELVLYLQSIQK
ncbi:c-type cytochrome [Pseudogemmobacter sp. W21_MBD1_M6]|uniref:c-type cytochrome n=1 Tax=Pseudogemmobacter sp. W21_MBD1_M6 TaxID=3240271 RepID=UPI003F952C20